MLWLAALRMVSFARPIDSWEPKTLGVADCLGSNYGRFAAVQIILALDQRHVVIPEEYVVSLRMRWLPFASDESPRDHGGLTGWPTEGLEQVRPRVCYRVHFAWSLDFLLAGRPWGELTQAEIRPTAHTPNTEGVVSIARPVHESPTPAWGQHNLHHATVGNVSGAMPGAIRATERSVAVKLVSPRLERGGTARIAIQRGIAIVVCDVHRHGPPELAQVVLAGSASGLRLGS